MNARQYNSNAARLVLRVIGFLLFFAVSSFSAESSFYEGKTITLVVAFGPGGLADTSNRAIVPFLKKYIPGNPDIMLEYMPGGGGRKAANYIYNRARPDGLTIAWAGSTLITNAMLGVAGVEYEIDDLNYVGATNYRSHYVLFTRKELGLTTIEKVRGATGVRFGALSVGDHMYVQSRLFAYLLGLRDPRFVTGYTGPELDVAVERGEVDSRGTNFERLVGTRPHWLETMDFHAVFEVPRGGRDDQIAHLPELEDFARSKKERRVLELWRALRSSGQPYILPPGAPRDKVELLRGAFRKTVEDSAYVREFEKLTRANFIAILPEELEKLIKEMPREPQVVELLKTFAGLGPLPAR